MIPDGELLRSRVVTGLSATLEDALDRELDGYAVLSPRNALLDADDERGVVTFEDGVPTLAYHTGTDRGGPPALADIGSPPYQLELYALDAGALELPHRTGTLRVPPGAVAERLAADGELAARVREAALATTDPKPTRSSPSSRTRRLSTTSVTPPARTRSNGPTSGGFPTRSRTDRESPTL